MLLHPAEQKLVDDVAKYGWHIVMVSSKVGEPELPPFAFTIGLEATFDWPELLVYGLGTDILAAVLNSAVGELKERQTRPVAGLVLRDVLEGFECRLAPMAERHHREHLGFAYWFARHRGAKPELRCLQLLWPDRNGRFPDEPECGVGVKELQPLLAE